MTFGYGPVRPLSETLRTIGLAPKTASRDQRLVESDEKEKLEKKSLIEEARRNRQKSEEAPKQETKPAEKPKDRLASLFEEVQTLEKALREEPKKEEKKEGTETEISSVLESLQHISGFSAKTLSSYEWRTEEKSKTIAALFRTFREDSDALSSKVKKGELSEADAKGEVNKMLVKFVEALELVKDDLDVKPWVIEGLKKSLKG